jgi:hypothetical protein
VQVDGVLAIQRRRIGIGIVDRAIDRDAGIVDEDVEPPEMLCNIFHQLIDFRGRSLVGLEGAGLHAPGFQFLDDGFGLVGGSDIADGDVGALLGECAGAGGADAAGSAGDEGNLAGE